MDSDSAPRQGKGDLSPADSADNRKLSTWASGTPGLFSSLPSLFTDAGEQAGRRVLEFFTANIRNANTRRAYARRVFRFSAWCEHRGLALHQIEPMVVAAYVEELSETHSKPSVKQHLAAVRMLFDWLVTGQVVPFNPAASVRGPTHVVKKGKTPVLSTEEARQLLDSIDDATVVARRDRAIIALMIYSFARVGAVVSMNCEDYFRQGKRWWLRLHEKGGKQHDVPAHHNAEAYVDSYLAAANLDAEDGAVKRQPLFRTVDRKRRLTQRRLDPREVLAMVKRRAKRADLSATVCCHSFRAMGITAYLENGGTIEKAQQIAANESPRTTKLYDRTADQLSLDEIERVQI